jgi:hypothetical protein
MIDGILRVCNSSAVSLISAWSWACHFNGHEFTTNVPRALVVWSRLGIVCLTQLAGFMKICDQPECCTVALA